MEATCSKESCTGCMACINVCAIHAISAIEDSTGFKYPKIDPKICVSCGKCATVCPQISMPMLHEPKKVYAMLAKKDGLRNSSSSGGVFSLLAHEVLKNRGAVFGAAFNEQWHVFHCMAQTEDELVRLRTSKYVQSDIGLAFRGVKKELVRGRKVLFTGTPCQVAGLHKYLGKEYENLLTVDLVCHGVPSPGVFARWVEHEEHHHGAIESIFFRKKLPGWKSFRVRIQFKNGEMVDCKQNEGYMAGFLQNIYLRKSCYNCSYSRSARVGDITLGDYWGYQESYPEFIEDDDRGISLVLVNTSKGMTALKDIRFKVDLAPRTIQDAMRCNTVLQKPPKCSPVQDVFWEDYENLPWEQLIERYAPAMPEKEDEMIPSDREYYARPYVKRHWRHKISCYKLILYRRLIRRR